MPNSAACWMARSLGRMPRHTSRFARFAVRNWRLCRVRSRISGPWVRHGRRLKRLATSLCRRAGQSVSGVQTSWSAGLATTAMTGLLVFWLGFAPHTRQRPAVHAVVAAPTNAELAADNRLLLSIDDELSDQSQPVIAAAPVPTESRQTTHRPVGTITD